MGERAFPHCRVRGAIRRLVEIDKRLRCRGVARKQPVKRRGHHHVYVVYLRNPKRDGRAGYYVGMTGLTPDERFANHKNGIKAAGVVKRCGERLVPKLYAHLNPMTYGQAVKMEQQLAEELRAAGYVVFGGH